MIANTSCGRVDQYTARGWGEGLRGSGGGGVGGSWSAVERVDGSSS